MGHLHLVLLQYLERYISLEMLNKVPCVAVAVLEDRRDWILADSLTALYRALIELHAAELMIFDPASRIHFQRSILEHLLR